MHSIFFYLRILREREWQRQGTLFLLICDSVPQCLLSIPCIVTCHSASSFPHASDFHPLLLRFWRSQVTVYVFARRAGHTFFLKMWFFTMWLSKQTGKKTRQCCFALRFMSHVTLQSAGLDTLNWCESTHEETWDSVRQRSIAYL